MVFAWPMRSAARSTILLSVDEAKALMLSRCAPAEAVEVKIEDAFEYALAENVTSPLDLPPFDNSAVDGYAVFAEDTAEANREHGITMPVAAMQPAGSAGPITLPKHSAIRILTGAPMPDGADAVIMQEDLVVTNIGHILLSSAAKQGDYVRYRGSDVRADETVLTAGTALGPGEMAVLAAVGRSIVKVYRRPRVAIITTGDEVQQVGEQVLGYGKIFNSNRYCLVSLIRRAVCEVVSVRHVPDDLEDTVQALSDAAASGADAIVCTGGVSVGSRDFVKPAVERLGALELWRVGMKPGKPVAFGEVGSCLFFGLPGNPASAMVTFEIFVRPCLQRLAGQARTERPEFLAALADQIDHSPGRREYVRAWTEWQGGGYVATTTGAQASGRLRSMLGCNSLIVVPEGTGRLETGAQVHVIQTSL